MHSTAVLHALHADEGRGAGLSGDEGGETPGSGGARSSVMRMRNFWTAGIYTDKQTIYSRHVKRGEICNSAILYTTRKPIQFLERQCWDDESLTECTRHVI